MRFRMTSVLALAALGVALAVMPADAGSSRFTTFLIPCDGGNKHFDFQAGGFPASSNQFILGSQVSLFQNPAGLLYLVMRGQGDELKQFISLGAGESGARFAMPTFYQVTANALGNVLITIDAACAPGFGQTQGFATVFFN